MCQAQDGGSRIWSGKCCRVLVLYLVSPLSLSVPFLSSEISVFCSPSVLIPSWVRGVGFLLWGGALFPLWGLTLLTHPSQSLHVLVPTHVRFHMGMVKDTHVEIISATETSVSYDGRLLPSSTSIWAFSWTQRKLLVSVCTQQTQDLQNQLVTLGTGEIWPEILGKPSCYF